jgi:subtilisin family serine protease
VLVILDRSISEINKVHEVDFFAGVSVKTVEDLTGVSPDALEPTADSMALQIDENNFRQILKLELTNAGKENVLDAISTLEQIDGVMYAGPDYFESVRAIVPSDPDTGSLPWGLLRIQMLSAWEITEGSSDVLVGVIDSGIADHFVLNAQVTAGWDFVNNSSDTTDTHGHGTHVAGIIGAAGVAPNVTLIPLQVSRSGNGFSSSAVVEAIVYATENNIQILNYSGGTYENRPAQKQAIANYPGLFVCAAGNEGNNTDSVMHHPSAFDLGNIISVGASDEYDERWIHPSNGDESNFGATTVDLFAPGANIYSTWNDGGYVEDSGTSMAAPHVTGVAALIKSIRPDLSATEIKALILDNVDKVDALEGLCVTDGRLNAYKAVRAATEAQTFTGDVNNDGRADMILSRGVNGKRAFTVYLGKNTGGFAEPITTQSTRNFVYSDPAFVGDFNGDDKTDVLIHWVNGQCRQLLVYIGKGDGTFFEGANLSSVRGHDPSTYPTDFFVADVNGDNRDDFVVHYRSLAGKRRIMVYKGTTASPYLIDATTDAMTGNDDYYYEDPVFMGDFNGDGRDDLLVHWRNSLDQRQFLIYKGEADGTFEQGQEKTTTQYHTPEDRPYRFLITDINNDGCDDFIVHWKDDSGDRCNYVYSGSTLTGNSYLISGINALTSSNDYIETDPVFVGDFNGDGYSDMLVHWKNHSTNKRQLLLYTGKSDRTYNTGTNYPTSNAHDPATYAGSFYVADVDGDGKDDFIVKWHHENTNDVNFLTYRWNGSGFSVVRSDFTNEIPYYNAS